MNSDCTNQNLSGCCFGTWLDSLDDEIPETLGHVISFISFISSQLTKSDFHTTFPTNLFRLGRAHQPAVGLVQLTMEIVGAEASNGWPSTAGPAAWSLKKPQDDWKPQKIRGFFQLVQDFVETSYPVVRRERFGAFGVFIFPIDSLFNGEIRSYLEFPNHLVETQRMIWHDLTIPLKFWYRDKGKDM